MNQEAYHGTSLENAKKICKSSNDIDFKVSCKDNEWLCNGVYFFDNKKNAMKNMPESMLIGRIQICVVNNNCISNCKIIME